MEADYPYVVVGIDPGKTGGCCLMAPTGKVLDRFELPEFPATFCRTLIAWRGEYKKIHVYLEKAQSRPGNAATAMFTYGRDYGVIVGLIMALGFSFHPVNPKTWMKVMHKGCSSKYTAVKTKKKTKKLKITKQKSFEVAMRLWPLEDFRKSKQATTMHDGIAEAMLIAEYGRKQLIAGLL